MSYRDKVCPLNKKKGGQIIITHHKEMQAT